MGGGEGGDGKRGKKRSSNDRDGSKLKERDLKGMGKKVNTRTETKITQLLNTDGDGQTIFRQKKIIYISHIILNEGITTINKIKAFLESFN